MPTTCEATQVKHLENSVDFKSYFNSVIKWSLIISQKFPQNLHRTNFQMPTTRESTHFERSIQFKN